MEEFLHILVGAQDENRLIFRKAVGGTGQRLQHLIAQEKLGARVELGGTFCMGKCQEGVCVTVDYRFFSVSPDTVDGFFENEIKAKAV